MKFSCAFKEIVILIFNYLLLVMWFNVVFSSPSVNRWPVSFIKADCRTRLVINFEQRMCNCWSNSFKNVLMVTSYARKKFAQILLYKIAYAVIWSWRLRRVLFSFWRWCLDLFTGNMAVQEMKSVNGWTSTCIWPKMLDTSAAPTTSAEKYVPSTLSNFKFHQTFEIPKKI